MKSNMIISKKIIGFLVLMALTISCDNGMITITPEANPKEWYISSIFDSSYAETSIHEYNQFIFYYDEDIDVIPLSIYMIDQKHYGRACEYMYTTISNRFKRYSITPDSVTKEYLIYYLKKGVEMNDTDCAASLAYLYMEGEWVERDSVIAKNYMMSFYPKEDAERNWKLLKRITIEREQE